MSKLLINKDTAVWRGVRTAIQGAVGFLVGLVTTVWAVPGVPQAVEDYMAGKLLPLVVGSGAVAGAVAFIWNAKRKDVKTK